MSYLLYVACDLAMDFLLIYLRFGWALIPDAIVFWNKIGRECLLYIILEIDMQIVFLLRWLMYYAPSHEGSFGGLCEERGN